MRPGVGGVHHYGDMTDDSTPTSADDAQAKLDAKFAALRQVTGVSAEKLAKFGGSGAAAERFAGLAKAGNLIASQHAVHEDLMRNMPDLANMPDARAARASEKTAEYMGVLVDAARDTERRETTMLRWTVASVVLAAIAAITGVISILR